MRTQKVICNIIHLTYLYIISKGPPGKRLLGEDIVKNEKQNVFNRISVQMCVPSLMHNSFSDSLVTVEILLTGLVMPKLHVLNEAMSSVNF